MLIHDLLGNFWLLLFVTIIIIVATMVSTLAHAWQKVRRAELETALKQQMLQQGLTVEEMERLLRAASTTSGTAGAGQHSIEELLEALVVHASPPVIEQVLMLVRAADASTQQAVCRAVGEAVGAMEMRESEEGANSEAILAVVRGMCAPVGPPPASSPAPPAEVAPSPRPQATLASSAIRTFPDLPPSQGTRGG